MAMVVRCTQPPPTAIRIYFLAEDTHVHEVAWFSDAWHHRDVSAEAGAPPASAGTALAVTNGPNDDPRVYFLAEAEGELHVHQLAWRGNAWYHTDVTAAAGAPPAVNGSSLTALTYHSEPRIYYVAADGHVHELAWMSYLDPYTAGWYHLDVSNETGAPTAAVDSSLASLTYHTEPRIYYVAADQTVHELAWMSYLDPANAHWYHLGVGAEAGAPPVTPGSTLGVTTYQTEPCVYYLAADRHVLN
ncbi:MAG: hypothetical protein R2838_07625 [Caldilineaceae bacterium]